MTQNATLVVPHFEVNPVWQDSSSFADIFDVDHFIDVLRNDVSIVKELPSEHSWSTREYYATGIRDTRIKIAPVQATAEWYIENVLPILQRYVIKTLAADSYHSLPLSMLEVMEILMQNLCSTGIRKSWHDNDLHTCFLS